LQGAAAAAKDNKYMSLLNTIHTPGLPVPATFNVVQAVTVTD